MIDNWPELNTKLPWKQDGEELWSGASSNYAKGLSGDVTAVQTPSKAAVGGGDIFKEYEWPIVQRSLASGRITNFEVKPVLPERAPRP